jgi:hypothetical protein
MRIHAIWTAAVALAGLAGICRAQGDPCPNERATNIDSRNEYVGDAERCGIGLVLLGQEISLFGPTCHDFILLYPAYQECAGETLTGHRCVPEQELGVRLFDCECATLSIPLLETGIAMPDCDCDDVGELGHVEDFQTVACQ